MPWARWEGWGKEGLVGFIPTHEDRLSRLASPRLWMAGRDIYINVHAVILRMSALMLERLLNHLLQATEEGEPECLVCFEGFSDTLPGTPLCSRGHRVCYPCTYRLMHDKLLAGRTPLCPWCREALTRWRLIDVNTLAGGRFSVPVHGEDNTSRLKQSIRLFAAVPIGCIRLVKTEYDASGSVVRRVQLEDSDDISDIVRTRRDRSLSMVIRTTMASYTLLLDIPRCNSAPTEYKCVISQGLLLHPVRGADGRLYEAAAAVLWVQHQGNRSPLNGNPLQPLTPYTDAVFLRAVRSFTPDPAPPLRDDNAEIEVNIVCPLNDTTRLTVRLGDNLADVVQRVKPGQARVIKENGTLFSIARDVATLNQCHINDGDTLYLMKE